MKRGGRFLALSTMVLSTKALAADPTIASIVNGGLDTLRETVPLLEKFAFVAGVALIIKSLFKFKEYNESGGQVKLVQPIVLLLSGVILTTVGAFMAMGVASVFGGSSPAGGGTGINPGG